MLYIRQSENIHLKEDFYKEYSKNLLYKKLILKLRRLENKFYRDMQDIKRFKPRHISNNFQPRMSQHQYLFINDFSTYLKMMKEEFEIELLKLQFKTLIDIYSKFGQDSYKSVVKNYEYIVKLNENIFNNKLFTL